MAHGPFNFSCLFDALFSLSLTIDSGRVKVFARIRPFNKDDIARKAKFALKISEEYAQASI